MGGNDPGQSKSNWDAYRDKEDRRRLFDAQMDAYEDYLWRICQRRPRKILEVGCAVGFRAAELARRLDRTHFVVLDLGPLKDEFEALNTDMERVTQTTGDARKLEYDDGLFDAAYAFGIATYNQHDYATIISEMLRVSIYGVIVGDVGYIPKNAIAPTLNSLADCVDGDYIKTPKCTDTSTFIMCGHKRLE